MNSKRPRNHRNNQRRGSGQGGGRPNSFDSNGPDVKIRGNPNQIFEKYQSLARDATSSGDRVMAENYLQHAEHYYRIFSENNAQRQLQQQQQNRQQQRQDEPDQPIDTAAEAPQEASPEAQQEAIVEKKEPIVDVPSDPAHEPQPVIE